MYVIVLWATVLVNDSKEEQVQMQSLLHGLMLTNMAAEEPNLLVKDAHQEDVEEV